MASPKKTNQLQDLLNAFEKNANFALIKYEKTTHKSLEELRKELKANDASLSIIKNSLFEKAVKKLAQKDKKLNEVAKKTFPIKDNSALLSLGQDWSKGLGAFHKFSEKEKTLSFKIGFLENEVYLTQDLLKIAKLPSKEELVAKVIGGMKSPSSKFVYALKFNMQKLVFVLNAKAQQG